MHPLVAFAGLPLACYLCGAVPFGWIAGRLNGIDIRTHGSRNVGATNVGRVLGWAWGLAVFVLDLAKGLAPVAVAGRLLLEHPVDADERAIHLARALCAFAAVAGHVWTFWLCFRGGKGVATALGAVLAVWPEYTWAGAVGLGVWLLTVAVTRYVSAASIAGAVGFTIAYFAFAGAVALGPQLPLAVLAAGASLLIIVKHRSNIARLLAGTEPRLGQRPADTDREPTVGGRP